MTGKALNLIMKTDDVSDSPHFIKYDIVTIYVLDVNNLPSGNNDAMDERDMTVSTAYND